MRLAGLSYAIDGIWWGLASLMTPEGKPAKRGLWKLISCEIFEVWQRMERICVMG